MIQIEDFYDDQGTYIFRKPEYPKEKFKAVYKNAEEAKDSLVKALKEIIQIRQQNDMDYIREGYKKSIARIAARLPEIKREEALSGLSKEVADDVRNILKNNELEPVIPREFAFGAVPCDVDEIRNVIHNVSGNLSSKEIYSILDEYLSYDPDFSQELKKEIFLFEDVVYLNDYAIQKILREIDSTELMNALLKSDKEIINKFLRNMSDRAGKMLIEDMHYAGEPSNNTILKCQFRILRVIRQLADVGEIGIEKFDPLIL